MLKKYSKCSYCGYAFDMQFVVTTELSVGFSSEMCNPSGISFAAVSVGCVHVIGKISASIVVGLWICLLGSQRAAVANCCAKKQWIYACMGAQ